MPIKTENGQVVLDENSNVTWIYEDGQEKVFDIGKNIADMRTLTGESVSRKNKLREMETKYKAFEGIENPEEYRMAADEAMQRISNFEEKDHVAADKVDELKNKAVQAAKERFDKEKALMAQQIKESQATLASEKQKNHKLLVMSEMSQSDYLKKQTNLSPMQAYEMFGRNFTIEDADGGDLRAVPLNKDGEKMSSPTNPYENLPFDEGIETFINARTDKDYFMKSIQPGSGSQPNTGAGLSMQDMLNLSPTERLNAARAMRK